MNNLQKLLIILPFVLLLSSSKAQKIINVNPKLVGNNIEITYEIKGAKFNQVFNPSLYVSYDGGNSYSGPMSLILDKKKEIFGGVNTLIWDVFKDTNRLDTKMIFDVKAEVIEKKIEKQFFVQYSFGALVSSINYITPIGFRIGMVGGTGWYIAGYFNTIQQATYTYHEESMSEPIFYEFTNKTLYPRMVVTAGFTHQLNQKIHLFAGAGYATKKFYKQINEYTVDGTLINQNLWVNMTEQDESGVEIETGTILNFNKLSLSLGLTTFNLKQIGINAGIGLIF